MAARRAHKAARWIGLQPTLSFAPVPDAVFWAEHPSPALAVEHRQVAYSEPECASLQSSIAPLLDQ